MVFVGPNKLFVLIKAPSSFNQPQHFLPKRDFKYNRKVSSTLRTYSICGCPFLYAVFVSVIFIVSGAVFGISKTYLSW